MRRNVLIAIVFSLVLGTSGCSSQPTGGHNGDIAGALIIAAILGGAMAVHAHQ